MQGAADRAGGSLTAAPPVADGRRIDPALDRRKEGVTLVANASTPTRSNEAGRARSRTGPRLVGVVGGTVLALWAGATVPLAADSAYLDPDRLLVVDCALPAQLRSLGGAMKYLGPRRAVRTTVSDCEIRGGEYVAYDRANYSTALRVWLPQAEAGDARAQAYVGEIFEKGLGTAPDYVKAAEWYEKAAKQEDRQAQANLGYLVEQGLGVPKDALRAMNLYRRAAGLTGDDLTFVSEVVKVRAEAQAKLDEASSELEASNQAITGLQSELGRTQAELERTRTGADAARRDATALRERIALLQRDGATVDHSAELNELRAKLNSSEALLLTRQQELSKLQGTSNSATRQLQAQLDASERNAAQLRAQLTSATSAAQEAKLQLAAAEARLNLTTQERQKLKDDVEAKQRALKEETGRLAQADKLETAAARAESQRAHAALADKDAERQQQQLTIAGLDKQVGDLKAEIERLRRTASDAASRADGSRKAEQQGAETSAAMRATLAAAQALTLRKEQELAAATAALEATRHDLAQDRATLATTLRDSTAKQGEMSANVARLNQAIGDRDAKIIAGQAQIAGLQRELELRKQAMVEPQTRGAAIGAPPPLPADASTWGSRFDAGVNYALIIANYEYAHFPVLKTVRQDAEGIEKVLVERYGYKGHTRLLPNANRKAIMNALMDLARSTHERDSVVIYFAGHGALDETGTHGFWLPVDAEPGNPTEWVSDRAITDLIAMMNARHILVIADSCYAGTMTRSANVRLVSKAPSSDDKRLNVLAKLRSRTVLTAGGIEPVLDSDGGDHSIFARALLSALWQNNRVLEGVTLFGAVYSPVQAAASHAGRMAGTPMTQTPGYSVLADAGHQNGDFLLIPAT